AAAALQDEEARRQVMLRLSSRRGTTRDLGAGEVAERRWRERSPRSLGRPGSLGMTDGSMLRADGCPERRPGRAVDLDAIRADVDLLSQPGGLAVGEVVGEPDARADRAAGADPDADVQRGVDADAHVRANHRPDLLHAGVD